MKNKPDHSHHSNLAVRHTRGMKLIIAALVLIPSVAWGHGIHEWINKGNYKAANGSHCCSERDCVRGGTSNLKRIEGGFEFDAVALDGKTYHLTVTDSAVHSSIDANTWWCALPTDLLMGQARCLFLPGSV